MPFPAATTSPSMGFSFAVSGIMIIYQSFLPHLVDELKDDHVAALVSFNDLLQISYIQFYLTASVYRPSSSLALV